MSAVHCLIAAIRWLVIIIHFQSARLRTGASIRDAWILRHVIMTQPRDVTMVHANTRAVQIHWHATIIRQLDAMMEPVLLQWLAVAREI